MLFTPEVTRPDKKGCGYIKSLRVHACGWISSVGVAQTQEKTWRQTEWVWREGRRGNSQCHYWGRERLTSSRGRERERERASLWTPSSCQGFQSSSPGALLSRRTTKTDRHTQRGFSRWTYLHATGVRSSAEDKTQAQAPYMEQTLSLNSVSPLIVAVWQCVDMSLLFGVTFTSLGCLRVLLWILHGTHW